MRANTMWRPYATFFRAGQNGRGLLVLLLQLSILFWPLAIRMARSFDEARGIQHLLNEFSRQHDLLRGNQAAPKRFRQVELAATERRTLHV